jgi:hypothetical protein
MSELPNFKEGFIFNVKEKSDFKVTALKPCLFKIAPLNMYSKNYLYWSASIATTVTDLEGNINVFQTNHSPFKIKSYDNLSFMSQSDRIMFVWKDVIYYYCSIKDLQDNTVYNISLTRHEDVEGTNFSLPSLETINFSFECNFINADVSYLNNEIQLGNNGYEIMINNPVTTLDWSYNLNKSSDELKYYQFLLYNSQNKCVVDTGKVYTNTTTGNGFVCNSLDDKSTYTLVGYCVSQNGQRLDLPDLIIKTMYTTGRIYANLIIELNKQLAENTVCAEMVNLVGKATNGEVSYIEGEKIDLKSNDNTVVFTDDYGLLKDNFVVRLWINGIANKNKVTILQLSNPNGSDYIEIYYEDGYFYAIKYSCGLTFRYISNAVNENDVLNGNIYLSVLYCNGRVDIYATSYAESEAIAQ